MNPGETCPEGRVRYEHLGQRSVARRKNPDQALLKALRLWDICASVETMAELEGEIIRAPLQGFGLYWRLFPGFSLRYAQGPSWAIIDGPFGAK
jgi:hypothetical protein